MANDIRNNKGRFIKGVKPLNYTGIDTCTMEGCNNPHRGKGYCQKHYMRLYHTGSVDTPYKKINGTASERFTFFHTKNKNGCWEWRGKLDKRGYGRLVDDTGWRDMAHRWSYKHFVGEIPEGLVINHKCHNPKCVNPEHLEATTHYDNIVNKGVTNAAYINAQKTHCNNGHELTEDNIYRIKTKYNGSRVCKICHRARTRRYLKKKQVLKEI